MNNITIKTISVPKRRRNMTPMMNIETGEYSHSYRKMKCKDPDMCVEHKTILLMFSIAKTIGIR